MKPIRLYDKNLQLKAFLENAFSISYEQSFNEIWTAAFSLPFDDPKTAEVSALDFIELFDGDKRIGMFRIIPTETVRNENEKTVRYQCEHVLATLLDDVLFGYHQLTNYATTDVLDYIIDKQLTTRWQLGTVAITRYFHYSWEHENLISALFSVPKPFDVDYQWTWDDSTYPWTLNLVAVSSEITGEIRYGKNLRGITKEEDPTEIVTRIYPLGYGEGVNQLNITKVNPTGLPYIEAEPAIVAQYGVLQWVWVDRRFENADSLYNSAVSLLNKLKYPKVTYKVDAIDYEAIDPYQLEKYEVGKLVRIRDEELGITVEQRIMKKTKSDVAGAPLDVSYEIANKSADLGTTQADLERRTKINETYAQGATNIDSHNYNDNCDATHPAIIRFYLPDDLVNINTMTLSYETEKFRAYEQATKGGGATTATSSSGGGTTATSSAGGATTATSSSGGGSTQTSSSGGGGTATSSAGGGVVTSTEDNGIFTAFVTMSGVPENAVGEENYGYHMHEVRFEGDLWTHTHQLTIPAHTHDVTIPAHTHSVSIPAHTHNVTIPAHTHDVTIPDHTHEVTIPDHTHELLFGIYEHAEIATAVTVKVDGQTVPGLTSTSTNDFNIVPYLSKDSGGKINRGTWHTVEIFPDKLARINATIISRLFITSRSGGTF